MPYISIWSSWPAREPKQNKLLCRRRLPQSPAILLKIHNPNAMFPIRGDICILCFFQGLTPPLHPAPGTTRSDVTLARECQRLGASGCFSAECSFRPSAFLRNDETNLPPDFATLGYAVRCCRNSLYPKPLNFFSQKFNFIISPQREQSVVINKL